MEKYDNLGMVGEGSYGMVMKCKHKESGQIVAIKRFLESEDDKMVKKIAMREVRMLRKLRHENLVNLIEVFRRRKRLYLVFEFVDHTVLDDLEKYPNGLSELTVRKILWQVLRGVEFCHSHNIIHRDIKPENILNSRAGVIKLCDFGFARTLASPGEVYTDYVATRWYRAPELLVGDTKYGRPVDIWAVGCLITEMLTGDPLFPGDSDIDQLYQIIKCFGNLCPRHREIFQRNPLFAGMRLPDVRDVDPLEKKFPKFSSEVLDLMKQCLRLDPNDRPSSSMLLRHEFFKKDNFEEKVIPDLRARILKDAANNMLVKKESNKEKDIEKKKKKIKELVANGVSENQSSESINTNKKASDQKIMQNNSPKKQDASSSPKKQDASNSPKKQDTSNSPKKQDTSNSPKKQESPKKQDASNSPKKQDTSNSPKKHEPPSPKKDNLPKSILKTSSNTSTTGNALETKAPRKNSNKIYQESKSSESFGYSKHLPDVESTKQKSEASADISRVTYKKYSPKDASKSNIPPLTQKKSSEDIISKSTSNETPVNSTNHEKVKFEKSRKSSTKRDFHNDAGEYRQQRNSDTPGTKIKTIPPTKVSSDTAVVKEMYNVAIERDAIPAQTSEVIFNSKNVPSPDYKSSKKDPSRKDPSRKEAFRKSPKDFDNRKSPKEARRSSIPPISNQNSSKTASPEFNFIKSSPTSSPALISPLKTQPSNITSSLAQKNFEKSKKNTSMKKTDVSPQSSFDRTMYPDKTSHFEKMMISMSGATAITHPALKKSHPAPQFHLASVNSGISGSSGMQYLRHLREDKFSNLPIWSSMANEEKSPSIHSSLESKADKIQRVNEEFSKPREKSGKHAKKENKMRSNYIHEEKQLRELKPDSQVTRLPDLGRKQQHAPEYAPVSYSVPEIGAKQKRSKAKGIANIPSLDVLHRPSRSPSPTNIIEGNFPSVYKNN